MFLLNIFDQNDVGTVFDFKIWIYIYFFSKKSETSLEGNDFKIFYEISYRSEIIGSSRSDIHESIDSSNLQIRS